MFDGTTTIGFNVRDLLLVVVNTPRLRGHKHWQFTVLLYAAGFSYRFGNPTERVFLAK